MNRNNSSISKTHPACQPQLRLLRIPVVHRPKHSNLMTIERMLAAVIHAIAVAKHSTAVAYMSVLLRVSFCSVPSTATSVPPRHRRLWYLVDTLWSSFGQLIMAGCRYGQGPRVLFQGRK